MGKAGYTGNQPDRTLSARSYPGAWNVDEQFIERKNGDWPEYPAPISRSLRFNSSDSAYLSRTPASAGNRKTWTWAGWVKLGKPSNFGVVFDAGAAGTDTASILVRDTGVLQFYAESSSTQQALLQTSQVLRDYSAWYHLVLSVDTTQATASNRIKFYLNGSRITSFSTATYPNQNADFQINAALLHRIGRGAQYQTSFYFDGYLADCFLIDGQALDPTSFGEFDDNGIWQPIKYRGVYGSNGFHLPFSDNSTAAALGTDTSGNGNDWTVNNISVSTAYFSVSPVPTEPQDAFNGVTSNYAYGGVTTVFTLNPPVAVSGGRIDMIGRVGPGYTYKAITNAGTFTLSEIGVWPGVGGSYGQQYSVTDGSITSLLGVQVETTSGNWTLAGVQVAGNPSVVGNQLLVIPFAVPPTDSLVDVPTNGSEVDTGLGAQVRGNYCTLNPLDNSGNLSNGNLDFAWQSASERFVGGTIAIPSSGKWFYEVTVNSGLIYVGLAVSSGTGAAPTTVVSYRGQTGDKNIDTAQSAYGATYTNGDVIGVAVNADTNQVTFYKNGASQGAISYTLTGKTLVPYLTVYNGSVTANFGQRPFAYTAPSGFKALCTANLPAPVVTKPSTVMDVKLYTGNGSTQTISGLGFSPDLVWYKSRSSAYSHRLWDTVRGATKGLLSDGTDGEFTEATGLTSFNSDGFAVGSYVSGNNSGSTYAAWCWDASSSTVTNTQGSITSSVRANPSAGFSIVTYTTPGSLPGTIGHGIGAEPYMIITKSRGASGGWGVYHKSIGNTNLLLLNGTNASTSGPNQWNSTTPTSTVFSIGTDYATSATYVAYCFAPVAGYSSMGSYVGNGQTSGVFVYTGFRPRWVLIKKSSSTGSWYILDTARDTYNQAGLYLYPDLSNAEGDQRSVYPWDILSNGFIPRAASGSVINDSGATYIYFAIAESPFQYARAR